MLYSDHEALPQLPEENNARYIKWVEFLQNYTFVFKHKAKVENKVADALSRRVMILVAMSREVTGFDRLIDEYELCPDLREIYIVLRDGPTREMNRFLLHDGYLFRFYKLCISRTSLMDFLSWELHAGGLAGYFGQNKTTEAVEHRLYWPSLKRRC